MCHNQVIYLYLQHNRYLFKLKMCWNIIWFRDIEDIQLYVNKLVRNKMGRKPIIIAMLISNSDFGCWFNLNNILQQPLFPRADNVSVDYMFVLIPDTLISGGANILISHTKGSVDTHSLLCASTALTFFLLITFPHCDLFTIEYLQSVKVFDPDFN